MDMLGTLGPIINVCAILFLINSPAAKKAKSCSTNAK